MLFALFLIYHEVTEEKRLKPVSMRLLLRAFKNYIILYPDVPAAAASKHAAILHILRTKDPDRLPEDVRSASVSSLVSVSDTGRPYLPDFPDFHFSISHTGDLAVLAWSPERELGIDLQRIVPLKPDPLSLAERFFTPGEAARIRSLSEGRERELLFFRLWTAKEAFAKMTGAGMTRTMGRFEADPEEGFIKNAGDEACSGDPAAGPAARLLQLPPPADDCLMTLCYEDPGGRQSACTAGAPPLFFLVSEPS